MGRISILRGGATNIRQLLRHNDPFHSHPPPTAPPVPSSSSSSFSEALFSSEAEISSFSTPPPPNSTLRGALFSGFTPALLSRRFLQNRMLSSSTSPSPGPFVPVNSEEELRKSLSQAQDECLPAIFYFTAAWCGPCRFIAPTIAELSKQYPHVTVYKVDIDQEGLEKLLTELNITSVPRFYFYHKGERVSEVLHADADLVKNAMERYYKLN